jgi:multimeric flavodoxin WrbA
VYHSRTGSAQRMLDAVLDGARDPAIEGVEVRVRRALEPDPADVRWAHGILLGTPANFGTMSGALKHFFDEVYDACLEHTRGRPYALFVKGRSDVDGAIRDVGKITAGLAWREVLPPVAVVGDLTDEHLAACTELGATMAAGLAEGIF